MSPGDRMTKGLDFMLKGIGPKDKTPESGGEAPESGVTTQESGRDHSRAKSHEGRVQRGKSPES